MTLSVHQIPVKVFPPCVDYTELIDLLEKKHGYQTRDYLNTHSHFPDWCDARGIGVDDVDANGDRRHSSRIWYAEYQADPAGGPSRPEYQDFWHWMMDQIELERGGVTTFYIDDAIEELNEADDETREEFAFVIRILADMMLEIKDHPAYNAEYGSVDLHIDW